MRDMVHNPFHRDNDRDRDRDAFQTGQNPEKLCPCASPPCRSKSMASGTLSPLNWLHDAAIGRARGGPERERTIEQTAVTLR